MDIDFSHIATQILAFLVMLWILKRYGWKPILHVLDERREKIKAEFEFISQQKDEVGNLIGDYKQRLKEIDAEARLKIQEAVTLGQKIAMEIQEEVHRKAKDILSNARAEVGEEIVKARNHLKNEIVNMAVDIAEKILKEKIDDQEHKKLIADIVKEAELK